MDRQKKVGYTGQPSHGRYRAQPLSNYSIYDIYSGSGRRLSKISNTRLFVLSVLAGGFMCAASLLSVLLVVDTTLLGIQNLLSGLGLTVGLLLVLLMNGVLFSEANIYIPANFYQVTIMQGLLRLFRFWFISWIGNFLGAILFAYLLYISQGSSIEFSQILAKGILTKLAHLDGLRGTGKLLISGMLANWIIALVAFYAGAFKNFSINQFAVVFLTFVLINAANLQYFPINLGYYSLSSFFGGNQIGLSNSIFFNLIPVSLGNTLGAAILVSCPLLFFSRKPFTHVKT